MLPVIGNPSVQGRHLHIEHGTSSEIGKMFVFPSRCLSHRVFLHKAVNQGFKVLLKEDVSPIPRCFAAILSSLVTVKRAFYGIEANFH